MENYKKELKLKKVDSVIAELIPWFIGTLQKDLDEIQKGLENNDFEQVRFTAHKLKGIGSSYGFEDVTDIGLEMEISAQENDRDKTHRLFDEFKQVVCLIKKEFLPEA